MKQSTPASSHITFIPFGSSVVLKRCVDLDCGCKCSFHCPFCDLSHYKATKPSRVQEHLEESHWPNAVQYKDLLILRCFHLCAGDIGGHYHCPLCSELVDRRFKFVTHLQAHLCDKGESVHQAYAPDAKQPPCLVYRNFTLWQCEDSCWNSPEPGLGHYHCPGCDNVQPTTSSMANHLRKCYTLTKMKQEASIYTRTLENPQQVFAEYWHKSIVRNTSDIPVRRCCSRKCCNRLYHCPLCTYERTAPNTIANLRIHFSYHQDNAVRHRGYTILACHLDCEQYGVANPALHYHCPYCGVTKLQATQFSSHLDSCRQHSFHDGDTEDAPDPEVGSSLENEDTLCQAAGLDDNRSAGEIDRSLPKSTLDSKAQIEMFDSVTATLSQPFLKVFNFPSLAMAEQLLSDVAGAASLEWASSPGTDPSRPVLTVKGSLANILQAESSLFEKFLEANVDKSVTVKTTNLGRLDQNEPEDFPASPESRMDPASPVTPMISDSGNVSALSKPGVSSKFLYVQPTDLSVGDDFGSVSENGNIREKLLSSKSANHDHRYSSTDLRFRTSRYADLGSTWTAGKLAHHSQERTELKIPDQHKNQGTAVVGDAELSTANETRNASSGEVLHCIVKAKNQGKSTSTDDEVEGLQEKREPLVGKAVQQKRPSIRRGSKRGHYKTGGQQTEIGNSLEKDAALPEKLATRRDIAACGVMRSASVKDCSESSPEGTFLSNISTNVTDTEEVINSPMKGMKRLSETPTESLSPKRYFTRGHRVDTSMFRKQNRAKDEPNVPRNSKSCKSLKAPRKDKTLEKHNAKYEAVTAKEDSIVHKQGGTCMSKQNTQMFLLNDLPGDIKEALASSSKTTIVGNQQVIYMNQMSETVKQFLESRSLSKSQSLEFNELPENLKRLLPPTTQLAEISVKVIPSTSEEIGLGSQKKHLRKKQTSIINGKDTEDSSVFSLNSNDATVENGAEEPEGITSAWPISKTVTIQPGASWTSEDSSNLPNTTSQSSKDLTSKVLGMQTASPGMKSLSPVCKSKVIQIPRMIATTQTVSSGLEEQSKVVLRKHSALPLPSFLDKQSCYIPDIEVGLSFTDVGLVVERTSLKQKKEELSQPEELLSFKSSPTTPDRGKGNVQKVSGVPTEVDVPASSTNGFSVSPGMSPQSRPILNEVETLKADKNIEAIELKSDNGVTIVVNKCMTCPVCGVRYFKLERLAAHIMFSHYKYKCEICLAVFTEKDALLPHLRSVHNATCQPRKRETAVPRSEICKCGHCSKRFTSRRKLDGHQHKAHGAVIVCSICNKICTDIYRLTSHIHVRHIKQSGTVCDICGKEFPIERYMNSHRRRHFQEKKHACPTCGKKFLDTNTLKDHIETHKSVEDRRYRYICSFCGKRFNSKRSFVDHTNIHTGNRPHVCKKCGKSFSYLTILRKHEKTKHDDRRPFQCELCSKAFKIKANLKAHMVTHTGISKFTCPFCQRCFGTAAICKTHISKCKVSKAFKHDPDPAPNAEAVHAMQISATVSNLQNFAEDSALVEAMQMAFENQQTVELQPTVRGSEEVLEETFLYMCSACSQTFDHIAAAEVHINQCQGATSSQEVW